MWLVGFFYLIFGIVIALFGINLFPYIGPLMVALFTIGVVCLLTLTFGWMATTWSCVLCILTAIAFGSVGGFIARRNIWLLIAFTGLIGGYFSGALINSAIAASSGWDPDWFYWVISCSMGAIGCLMAANTKEHSLRASLRVTVC